MNASIVSVGTELTAGLTVDTNAAWLARRLSEVGVTVSAHLTVPDEVSAIEDAIRRASQGVSLIIVTGGLGPTPDDLTREAIAEAAGVSLAQDDQSLGWIREYFAARNREMPESNIRQSMIPSGAAPIPNSCGTAPGVSIKLGEATLFALPGVPYEMRTMFNQAVFPGIQLPGECGAIVTRSVHSFGISEARTADQISDLMDPGMEPEVGITAKHAIITIRVNAKGSSRESAEEAAAATISEIRHRLGDVVFGEEDESLAQSVGRLLVVRGATIGTAESCTGGLLAKMLTDVPGSSEYCLGGFVTYSNELKTQALGVPEGLIASDGAVSEPVARSMADGCRRATGANYALATTGIAGPGGGSPEKPVGLVFIALAAPDHLECKRLLLGNTLGRDEIRIRSCNAALNMARRYLVGKTSQ